MRPGAATVSINPANMRPGAASVPGEGQRQNATGRRLAPGGDGTADYFFVQVSFNVIVRLKTGRVGVLSFASSVK